MDLVKEKNILYIVFYINLKILINFLIIKFDKKVKFKKLISGIFDIFTSLSIIFYWKTYCVLLCVFMCLNHSFIPLNKCIA